MMNKIILTTQLGAKRVLRDIMLADPDADVDSVASDDATETYLVYTRYVVGVPLTLEGSEEVISWRAA